MDCDARAPIDDVEGGGRRFDPRAKKQEPVDLGEHQVGRKKENKPGNQEAVLEAEVGMVVRGSCPGALMNCRST